MKQLAILLIMVGGLLGFSTVHAADMIHLMCWTQPQMFVDGWAAARRGISSDAAAPGMVMYMKANLGKRGVDWSRLKQRDILLFLGGVSWIQGYNQSQVAEATGQSVTDALRSFARLCEMEGITPTP